MLLTPLLRYDSYSFLEYMYFKIMKVFHWIQIRWLILHFNG